MENWDLAAPTSGKSMADTTEGSPGGSNYATRKGVFEQGEAMTCYGSIAPAARKVAKEAEAVAVGRKV